MNVVLPPEEFDAKKELADIGVQIAAGMATLRSLKSETEAYTLEREQEVMARIAKILTESHEALTQVAANKDALNQYSTDLADFSRLLGELLTEYRTLRDVMIQKADADTKGLDAAFLALNEDRKQLGAMASIVAADREANKRERVWIAEEKRRLADERGTLERAFNRIKK